MTLCDVQPPITEDTLWEVIDHVADSETLKHVISCQGCQERLREMQQYEGNLSRYLARFECPTSQELTDYHFGAVEGNEREAIRDHLEKCPRCQEELSLTQTFVQQISERPEPLTLIKTDNQPDILRPPHKLWQMTPTISGDLAMARGSDEDSAYDAHANSAKVYLDTEAQMSGMVIKGQIVDDVVDWHGAVAEVWQEGNLQQVERLDEECEFQFTLPTQSSIDLYITHAKGIGLMLERLKLIP
jgi:hypothetical protein